MVDSILSVKPVFKGLGSAEKVEYRHTKGLAVEDHLVDKGRAERQIPIRGIPSSLEIAKRVPPPETVENANDLV